MLLMSVLMSTFSMPMFYVFLGITVLATGAVIALSLKFGGYIRATVRGTAERISGFDPDFLEQYKYPVVVSGEKGDIIWCNARFRKNICGGRSPEGDNINAYLPGFNIVDITNGEGADVAIDGREFTVYAVSNRRSGRRGLPFYRQHRLQTDGQGIPRQHARRGAYQL